MCQKIDFAIQIETLHMNVIHTNCSEPKNKNILPSQKRGGGGGGGAGRKALTTFFKNNEKLKKKIENVHW